MTDYIYDKDSAYLARGAFLTLLRKLKSEILIDAAKPLRANVGPNEHGLVDGFNAQMTAIFAGGR